MPAVLVGILLTLLLTNVSGFYRIASDRYGVKKINNYLNL
jgi:hypothetical protein